MKMVKSLLLGTAAGLVAIAGAQAADLPVKAKPVQYVKICSLYGAGFYYIPGTDMCLKVGGWVRAEYMWGANGSTTTTMIADVNNRGTSNSVWRSRGYITADARSQSEYGTIRGYIAVGLSTTSTGLDNAANQFDSNRAFIQFAGFTFGRAQSFYDFYSGPAPSYWGNYPSSDTGDPGWQVLAYTAQFGNGLSGTIGVEGRRMTQIINATTATGVAGNAGGNLGGGTFSTAGSTTSGASTYAGFNAPDIVANLRIDQPWGGAQIMAAWHEVNTTYYGTAAPAAAGAGGNTLENSGHPSDKSGYALGAGLKLNAPQIGAGDYFQAQVNYTVGASRYIFFNPNGNFYVQNGQNAGYGLLSDAVYGSSLTSTAGIGTTAGSALELTTAWGVNASYEHFWNPKWRTSAYGGYAAVDYNANANAMLCTAQGQGTGGLGSSAVAAAGCDNSWSTWWVGSRTQWNVTPDTYMGLDVVYNKLQSASSASGLVPNVTIPATTVTNLIRVSDADNWSFRFRVHRDFYP